LIPLRDDNPTRAFAWVTVGLIGINIGAFGYEVLLRSQGALEPFVRTYGLTPGLLTSNFQEPRVLLSLFTSMFLHGGYMHLLGNMLYLWIFGNNVEDAMGFSRFIFFYLLCGLVAVGTQVAVAPHSQIVIIGASGAIAGVLGAYLIIFPEAEVYTLVTLGYFIRVVKLPAVLVLSFWIVVQFLSSFGSLGVGGLGGVAWFAHIGGFLAGMLLALPLRQRRRRWV